jgi:hypothetical protein
MNSASALLCENFDTSLYQDITQFYSGIIYSSVSRRHVGREACSKNIERAGPYTSAPPFTPTSVSWTYPVSGGRGGRGAWKGGSKVKGPLHSYDSLPHCTDINVICKAVLVHADWFSLKFNFHMCFSCYETQRKCKIFV